MQRIWVLCKHFGSRGFRAFFGGKLPGYGDHCPDFGSSWRQNQIIAATVRAHSSGILGNARLGEIKDNVQVIWLEP